ncbi:hypothetical protein TcasGA2_TC034614 [Tribolium castaneum]|uniref:Uncharacterized protein n=1 Tax=Tribolium castaneum TaxID=7070 RepID=A0A139WKJ5_TRICA|nr:hypothetical protein TcasGA2_TC034614 [Tribolium castaneum]
MLRYLLLPEYKSITTGWQTVRKALIGSPRWPPESNLNYGLI